jgi:hypothetical protein
MIQRANGTLESFGLYLLITEPEAVFEDEVVSLAAIVRRRDDPVRVTDPMKGTPSVRAYPSNPDSSAVALQHYDLLASTGSSCDPAGSACYAQLSQVGDIDMFMRYVALFTWLGNGDYIDELYWTTSSTAPNGSFYWTLNSWDTDDSFEFETLAPFTPGRGCHHGGINAQYDPHDMLFCSEGALDKVLSRSPYMYGLWADHLECARKATRLLCACTDAMRRVHSHLRFLLRSGLPAPVLSSIALAQTAEVFGLLDGPTNAGLVENLARNITTAAAARADVANSLIYYNGELAMNA